MQANFCTAKTGRGGALAVLLQQIAAVVLPAGRLPRCCLLCWLCHQLCYGMQRRIQPAAGLLRHHADARLLVQLAGVGQHHVLLLRQGGAQIVPAALRPTGYHGIALRGCGRSGQIEQGLLPVEAVHRHRRSGRRHCGLWAGGGRVHGTTSIAGATR